MKLSSRYTTGQDVWCRIGDQWLPGQIINVGRAYLKVLSNDRGFSMSLLPMNVRLRNATKKGSDKPEEIV